MRIFEETATREALPFDLLIARLREMFRSGCKVPARHVHIVESETSQGTVLIMPAWTGRYLGIKTVNIYPGNSKLGLPGLFSAYTLFDATTGQVLAQMDGNVITSRRTAAASALAASYLARKESKRLLVVGAGRVGSLLPRAYAEVFDLQAIDIWDRTGSVAEAVAQSLAVDGLPAMAVADLRDATTQADIVSCATLATSPVISGNWLRPGTHLDLIGSFTPDMRESDDSAFVRASVFVDTSEALQKSGDLLGPISRGVIALSDIEGTLADLCEGRVNVMRRKEGRTIFKSVGTALEDLAAAIQVFEFWSTREPVSAGPLEPTASNGKF